MVSEGSPGNLVPYNITIRRAEASDAAPLAEMIRKLARYEGQSSELAFSVDQLRSALRGDPPRLHAILAEDDMGPVGFVTYTVDFAIWTGGDILRVDDVYVRGRARGQGIGRRLMIGLGDLAASRGLSARWEVRLDNDRARRFYESLGVQITTKYVARWLLEQMRQAIARDESEIS